MIGTKKENLSLAGEYAVASEICRKDKYAQITLGHLKRTDILVFDTETGKVLRVEAKSKQESNWPGCKGIYGEGVLLVLVDFQGKELTERPDFYVLDSGEWKNFINTKLRPEIEKGSVRIDPKTNCPTWPSKDGSKPDYKGCDVSPQEVREYEEKWEKLRAALEK